MDIKEASTAVIELMKLEKALEPTCSDCEQCAILKRVKDEIINLSAFIIYEQARKVLSLTRKNLGLNEDPDIEKALDRIEAVIAKKAASVGSTEPAVVPSLPKKPPPPDDGKLN
jgi:hypothetical protein